MQVVDLKKKRERSNGAASFPSDDTLEWKASPVGGGMREEETKRSSSDDSMFQCSMYFDNLQSTIPYTFK